MSDLVVNSRLTIPSEEIRISVARSSGPGGQNVNKVNSKVTLRWSAGACAAIDPGWRARFETRFASRISKDGDLVLHSDQYRDQPRNLTDARLRLVEMLLECEKPPKVRKKTRPTKGSQRRRREAKTKHSQKKQGRRTRYEH